MNDLDKIIELGKHFAEPWKRATRVLSVLLLILVLVIAYMIYDSNHIDFSADFNNNSEIIQTKD